MKEKDGSTNTMKAKNEVANAVQEHIDAGLSFDEAIDRVVADPASHDAMAKLIIHDTLEKLGVVLEDDRPLRADEDLLLEMVLQSRRLAEGCKSPELRGALEALENAIAKLSPREAYEEICVLRRKLERKEDHLNQHLLKPLGEPPF